MTTDDKPPAEALTQSARRLLEAIDDASIPAIDVTDHAYYFEELRLVVEDFLNAILRPSPALERRVWLVWDCQDLVACYLTAHEAGEERADVQHQLLCDYGPDPELPESITVSTVTLEPADFAVSGPRV